MARPIERCVGEVISAGGGRQLGDRCRKRGYALQHHLCHFHQDQHNNPTYPTEDSYRLRPGERPDHIPPTEVQPNTSQAGPSNKERPVDNPSRISSTDESRPSNAPQRRPAPFRLQLSTIFGPSQLDSPQREPASSRSQLPTPPEQPDRRRHATPEPMTSPNRTPTQTSNTVIAPIRKFLPQYTPTPQGVSRESNQIRFPRPPSLPPTPASRAVNGMLPRSRPEQSRIPQPSPSTADRSLPTKNTPSPQDIRRESSEIRSPGLRNLPFTPASPNVPPRSRPEQSRIPQPSSSTADRSLPTQNALPPPVMRRESSANRSPRLYNLPPMPASPDLTDILSQFEPEQRGVSEPNSSSADSINGPNEIEKQPQRTHHHDSTNTSDHSSNAGSSYAVSTLSNSSSSLTPQARSIRRERSRLLRDLSFALIDAGQITSDDPLRAIFTEQTSVPGASSILDIIVDMLQGYIGLRYIDEIPKGLAAKLLRAACEDGEEGERFTERLRQWVIRGETVDDDVVEAFGLDDFEEWMRVGAGWMTRMWGFLGSMMDLRKEKRD